MFDWADYVSVGRGGLYLHIHETDITAYPSRIATECVPPPHRYIFMEAQLYQIRPVFESTISVDVAALHESILAPITDAIYTVREHGTIKTTGRSNKRFHWRTVKPLHPKIWIYQKTLEEPRNCFRY